MAKSSAELARVAKYRGAADTVLTAALDQAEVEAMAAIDAARLDRNTGWLAGPATTAKVKAVRKAAAAALHKLKSAGIAVEAPAPSKAWTLGEEAVEVPPPVAMLGLPGPDGYFPFLAITYGREGACVCTGMAGAGQGVRRDDHGHVSRSKAKEFVDLTARDGNLWAVPFQAAMHLLERAFKEGDQKPKGWGHLLEHITPAERSSIALIDPLRHEAQEIQEDALFQVTGLLDGDPGLTLMLDEEALYRGWTEVRVASESAVEVDEQARQERIRVAVDKTADEALRDIHRRTHALALDVFAYLSSQKGWDAPSRAAARHTALALRDGRKGSAIPLVRTMVERMLVQAMLPTGTTATEASP